MNEKLTEFYIRNQRFSSPNMDLSHRCILRCPQCLRQKVEGLPRIARSFDIGQQEFRKILAYYENQITTSNLFRRFKKRSNLITSLIYRNCS